MILSIKGLPVTLSINNYAECHYAGCRVLFIVKPSVVMLNVIMLNVVAPVTSNFKTVIKFVNYFMQARYIYLMSVV
jgi:hypothetical protein